MASTSSDKDIFSLAAERVALTSFRSAMAGYDLGDSSCWDELWATLVNEGGTDLACRLSGCLHFFVRSLRASRASKVNYFPLTCKRACADECLMLSLLSASQHGLAETLEFCLNNLIPENGNRSELQSAAKILSRELKASGLLLLPVPLQVIQSIVPVACYQCTLLENCGKIH